MQTTTYKCDRCGVEDTSDKIQLWQIGVATGTGPGKPTLSARVPVKEWCRACCVAIGILTPCTKEDKVATPESVEPNLEDLIREIVQDEMGQ